jgi:hypothetical protein
MLMFSNYQAVDLVEKCGITNQTLSGGVCRKKKTHTFKEYGSFYLSFG